MFNCGEDLELVYPVTTHIYRIHAAKRRVRQLRVHRVRDLVAEPLSVSEYARRPYISRSRWLVSAIENPGEPPRQFYLGSADNFAAPSTLQIALYEPGSLRPAYLLARQCQPTIADRRALLRFAREQEHAYPGYEVRIFASDLRLIS